MGETVELFSDDLMTDGGVSVSFCGGSLMTVRIGSRFRLILMGSTLRLSSLDDAAYLRTDDVVGL